jgi:tRNA pseudouridine synthase 10
MDPGKAGEEAGRGLRDAAIRAAEGWEFRTFLCGTRPPPGLPPEEADAFRKAANRGLGRALEEAWAGRRGVDFRRPEVRFGARFPEGSVDLDVAPLFVYGRYRKHSRALSQTPFHCPNCRGRGCAGCGGTGRIVQGSVAELLVPLLVEAAGAEDGAFKGCGREDADVRMLGEGRPFVVVLKRPRRRTLDLAGIRARAEARAAGGAEFPVLRPVDAEAGEQVPAVHPPKRYGARVEVEGGAAAGDGERLAEGLRGALLAQRTPVRVARRRADLVRERRVLGAEARLLPDGALALEVRTEGGTYVKEMISGDGGRTVPSASSILGRPCRCVELDVLEVEIEDPARGGPP